MKCILALLFLIFAVIEYRSEILFCSTSNSVIGNMWFMWIMMSLMCLEDFIKITKKK